MYIKLFFIRKIKALFSLFKLHLVFGVFEPILFNLLYLSKLSRWINQNKKLTYNDFYNRKVNYNDRFLLDDFVIKNENLDEIDYLEFGVAEGDAIKRWVKSNTNSNSRFYGFDIFTGSPEDFGVMKSYHFDTKGKTPDIEDSRVQFITGLFQNSLMPFLKDFKSSRRKIIHLDADLYTSTLFVLASLYPYLSKDDIIILDEFGVPTFEFRAFQDFFMSFNIQYEVIGAVNNYLQIAIKIK
jgi:O-methyltransferase